MVEIEEKDIKSQNTLAVEKYMLWQSIYELFTSGRRISSAVIVWYDNNGKKEEEDDKKENDL